MNTFRGYYYKLIYFRDLQDGLLEYSYLVFKDQYMGEILSGVSQPPIVPFFRFVLRL